MEGTKIPKGEYPKEGVDIDFGGKATELKTDLINGSSQNDKEILKQVSESLKTNADDGSNEIAKMIDEHITSGAPKNSIATAASNADDAARAAASNADDAARTAASNADDAARSASEGPSLIDTNVEGTKIPKGEYPKEGQTTQLEPQHLTQTTQLEPQHLTQTMQLEPQHLMQTTQPEPQHLMQTTQLDRVIK